jgi:hypothetical protein
MFYRNPAPLDFANIPEHARYMKKLPLHMYIYHDKHTNPHTASIATLPLHRVHRMNYIPVRGCHPGCDRGAWEGVYIMF